MMVVVRSVCPELDKQNFFDYYAGKITLGGLTKGQARDKKVIILVFFFAKRSDSFIQRDPSLLHLDSFNCKQKEGRKLFKE